MIVAKLQLTPAPTFTARVGIPVPGGEAATVEFTFKWRSRTALSTWLAGGKDRSDVDAIMDMATGWDLDEPFNRENVAALVENYIGAPAMLVEFYYSELGKRKLGN